MRRTIDDAPYDAAMIDPRVSRGLGASAFVVVAVAATVALASLRGDDPEPAKAARIVGAGAAPAAQGPIQPRQKVFGTVASARDVAAIAAGVNGDLAPLSASDFKAPVARYRAYAVKLVPGLRAAMHRLTASLRRDDRSAAMAAWDDADSAFARIGAAYGALGPLGDAIGDGGLARIEAGLWSARRPRAIADDGVRLQVRVARLSGVLRSSPIDPLTFAIRAHEILEDVQRDRLSRPTPSGSGVRATADAVAATKVVLGTLRHVLAGRGDAMAQSEYWLGRLSSTLRAIHAAHGGGSWPREADLSRAERQRLNGGVGAALEALAHIPEELETTRPPVIPRLAG
jgi:hypothetical protein